MDIATLVNITARAWALPILAKLNDGVPARQAPLLAATGASRTAFAQSMDHLIMIGLIERNPGHGHPLRPEFRLTPLGQIAAAFAGKILHLSATDDHPLIRRAWTVPVITTLHRPRQFTDIKRQLPVITDRALSQSLQLMEDHAWVHRAIDPVARPPRPIYSAVNTGAMISQVITPVVDWHP